MWQIVMWDFLAQPRSVSRQVPMIVVSLWHSKVQEHEKGTLWHPGL